MTDWQDVRQPAVELGNRVVPSNIVRLWRFGISHVAVSIPVLIILGMALMAAFPSVIAPHDPTLTDPVNRLASPSAQHVLGSDSLGRDVASRIVYGARAALEVAALATIIATAIGVPIGLLSGTGNWLVDTLLMRVTDAFIAIPTLILALAIVLATGQSTATIALALGVGAFPTFARLVRSDALRTSQTDFVLAARSVGASPARVLVWHVLPDAMPSIIVAASLSMAFSILGEAALSFLGVGLPPPTPTWGGMLNDAFQFIYTKPLLSTFSGAAIFLATLSFNLLGDAARDLLDPRLRGTRG